MYYAIKKIMGDLNKRQFPKSNPPSNFYHILTKIPLLFCCKTNTFFYKTCKYIKGQKGILV